MRRGHNNKLIPIGEKEACNFFGLKQTPASGATWHTKSDATLSTQDNKYRIEIKETDLGSLSIQVKWLDKIDKEATMSGREPLLLIRVNNRWLLCGDPELILGYINDKSFKSDCFCSDEELDDRGEGSSADKVRGISIQSSDGE